MLGKNQQTVAWFATCKITFLSYRNYVLSLHHKTVILMQIFLWECILRFVILSFVVDTPSAPPTQPSLPYCVPCTLTFLLTALTTGKTETFLNTLLDTEKVPAWKKPPQIFLNTRHSWTYLKIKTQLSGFLQSLEPNEKACLAFARLSLNVAKTFI